MTRGEPDKPDQPRLWFDVIVRPNRSLGPVGFRILMGVIVVITLGMGLRFLLIGAWPVLLFFGLDVLLIWFAFRLNYRAARAYELIQLSDESLDVTKVDPQGRSHHHGFQPLWLRLALERADSHRCRVILSSHGKRVEVGAALSPDERRDLASALDDALARHRAAI